MPINSISKCSVYLSFAAYLNTGCLKEDLLALDHTIPPEMASPVPAAGILLSSLACFKANTEAFYCLYHCLHYYPLYFVFFSVV